MRKLKKTVREMRIRSLAEDIFLKSQKRGIINDPERDWEEAESLYKNKFKYWSLCLWHFLLSNHYQILASAAVVSIFMSLMGINVSCNSTDLNMRPYVSIDADYPEKITIQNNTFYNKKFILKNSGRIPAAKISTQYYITTDLDKDNMNGTEWYEENLGGYGATALIVPDGTAFEPGRRSLSPNAGYYYFEAITRYQGLEENKNYWIRIIKIFYIDQTGDLFPVKMDGDWDRNKNFRPPSLSTREEVVNLLEEIKKKQKNKKHSP